MLTDLSSRQVSQATRAAGLGFAAYTALMLVFEKRMKAAGGPGIIALELAADGRKAQTILDSWGPSGIAAARRSLQLDFGYMTTYWALITLLSEAARRRFGSGSPLHRLAPAACAVAVAADAVEGVTLLRVVDGSGVERNARVAGTAARTKFAAIAVVLAYCAAARWSRVRA